MFAGSFCTRFACISVQSPHTWWCLLYVSRHISCLNDFLLCVLSFFQVMRVISCLLLDVLDGYFCNMDAAFFNRGAFISCPLSMIFSAWCVASAGCLVIWIPVDPYGSKGYFLNVRCHKGRFLAKAVFCMHCPLQPWTLERWQLGGCMLATTPEQNIWTWNVDTTPNVLDRI